MVDNREIERATAVEESTDERRPNGQFGPGNSFGNQFGPGNRASSGRPKKQVLTVAMEQLIAEGFEGDDRDLSRALADKCINMALDGNFQFFNLLMDRLDGKVVENLAADLHHTITLRHVKAELPSE